MKPATRNITALFFILLWAAPLLFIIITGIKQQEIRYSMHRQLEEKMLHTITLDKNEVYWVKDGKEILINGRMFDIKNFNPAGDNKISFTGLYDDEETELVNKIKENRQSENNTGGKLLAQLFRLLKTSFSNSPSDVFTPSMNNIHFPGIEQHIASPFIVVFSPPPQV